MDHVSSRVTMLTLALSVGCAKDCENHCYSEAIECIQHAQSTDERELCKQTFHDCYWRCPKRTPSPEWLDLPDE
jgi:hypothetical protein